MPRFSSSTLYFLCVCEKDMIAVCVSGQADCEKQMARMEREATTLRGDHQAATAAAEKSRLQAVASLEACERARAAAVADADRLKAEVASVREELASGRSSASSGSEQLRAKTEELLRCEAARATAEALCAELRGSLADTKVRVGALSCRVCCDTCAQ